MRQDETGVELEGEKTLSTSGGQFPNWPKNIIYNRTWSIVIQWIRDIMSGDKLT